MSVKNTFKTLFQIIISEMRAKNTIKRIQELKFNDISKYYPKISIFYSDEKLITLKNILDKIQIIYINEKSEYPNDYPRLENLFEEQFIGRKKVFFKDFHGVTCSKADGIIPFEVFKQEEYNFYTTNSEKAYKCYEDIRNAVLQTSDDGESPIISAYQLKWNNNYYASNHGKSHRFSALCKWNEIENKDDSEFFNVTEVSIDNKIREEFLTTYHGFLIDSMTAFNAKEIFEKSSIKPVIQVFPPASIELFNKDIALIAFGKKTRFDKIVDIFFENKNAIHINEYFKE